MESITQIRPAITFTLAVCAAAAVAAGVAAALERMVGRRRKVEMATASKPIAPEAVPKEPDNLLCPVTHILFRDPVFVVDSGNTYERDALCDFWRQTGDSRDPLTNQRLASRDVRTNWGVRREVQAFLDAHPDFVPGGWDSRQLPAPDQANVLPERPQEAAAWQQGVEPEPEEIEGIPAAAHAHCAAIARAHGGVLPEPLMRNLAASFQVEIAALQRVFGRGAAAGEEDDAANMAKQAAREELPAAVRMHCDVAAQAYGGGSLPDAVLQQMSQALNVDEVRLRTAYGNPNRNA